MIEKNNFKNYILTFKTSARKELDNLDKFTAQKIDKKLQDLITGLSNVDIKKMQGYINTYRMRCGDYRIIFEANKLIITILVVKIAHRKDVYRDY
jgi:mRNA interferase RelE/StbE